MNIESPLYVLDDDIQYAQLLSNMAQMKGWTSHVETNPSIFINSPPSHGVLILDLVMPEMDGIEVIRELAQIQSKLSLILVSGFDDRVLHSAKELANAHNINVVSTLKKPISLQSLTSALEKYVPIDTLSEKLCATTNQLSVEEVKHVISNNYLELFFQPQINLSTGKVIGAEALVRCNHPELGLLFPDSFINVAEENGLIGALTENVIDMAVTQADVWNNSGINLKMSVNVSPENITSLSLPEQLESLLSEHSVPPENLILELTETAVMEELAPSLEVINRLRMKGFSLSIDDFGTGHSSLAKLYDFPFNELKIDRMFVNEMLENDQAMSIVKICIMLGDMLNMKVVGEGVENQQVLQRLKELGCNIAQGYFISKPLPIEKFNQWYMDFNN